MKILEIAYMKNNKQTKLVTYFETLHNTMSILKQFANETFPLFVTFFYSDLMTVARRLKVKVYIIENGYDYAYSFIFSKHFLNYKNRLDYFLKLFLLSKCILQTKLSNSKII